MSDRITDGIEQSADELATLEGGAYVVPRTDDGLVGDGNRYGKELVLKHKKERTHSAVTDKSVIKALGYCSSGTHSNPCRVDVKDGRIVRVRPLHYDENYTPEELRAWRLEKNGHVLEPGMKSLTPPLSLGYKMRAYSKNRVPYPLIREDFDPHGERNIQNRGKSKYKRISWDDAIALVAEEVARIQKQYGPYSIYSQGEGHGESKNYNGEHGCQTTMLNLTGGCTVQSRQPDSWEGWYWGAKHVWGMEPVGVCNRTNNVIRDVAENGDAVLFWGADPETTPQGWEGFMSSKVCFWFDKIGIKSIHISPEVNYTNACHGDKWIPILPNTDAAMQLAIAYVWLTEGTYDQEYLDTHTVGFDWLRSYVLGGVDGIPKTPKWAEEKCHVKSYTIKALARYWAKHNVSISHCNGGGMVRSVFSHEPARLEICLLAMQGIGKPGRHQFRWIEWALFGNKEFNPLPLPETYTSLLYGYHGWDYNPGISFIAKTKLPESITQGKSDWYGHVVCGAPREDQFEHFDYPYKGCERMHMIWSDSPCWSTCWNCGNSYLDATQHDSIEFIVVQHPWLENDALYADLILPVSTVFECYDIANDNSSGQWSSLYICEQAIEPRCNSRSDFQITLDVAQKLEQIDPERYAGLHDKLTGGMTQEETLRYTFENSGKPDELTWEAFKNQEFWMSPTRDGWQDGPAGLHDFCVDPDNNPLQTPTGKIEIYSMSLAQNFPDDAIRAPYPQWVESGDGHDERIGGERAQKYPFLLMSNHPRWRVHAQNDDQPWMREIETCKIAGPDGYRYEPVWINPRDAEKLGIKHHDIVRVYNDRGGVLGAAYVTERIMEGVIYQDHGSRLDPIVSGMGGLDRGGANNLISPSHTTSKNAAGEVTNGFLAAVEPIDIEELARQYPEVFNRAYDQEIGLIPERCIVDEELV